MMSNLITYLSLARDALRNAKRFSTAQRKRKPDGQPGFIISYDLKKKSFKHSLIAIVFSGIYFETLIYIEIVRRMGKLKCQRLAKATYEDKLRALGISDESLLRDCKRFRQSRNDLVHEKAVEHASSAAKLRFAQVEAQHAVCFILQVTALLSPKKLLRPIARKRVRYAP